MAETKIRKKRKSTSTGERTRKEGRRGRRGKAKIRQPEPADRDLPWWANV